MNRCTPPAPSVRQPQRYRIATVFVTGLAVACCAVSLATSAQTSLRPFPPKAQRGVMQITQPPELLLDGRQDRLSPGARIHGTNDMLLMSGALIGQAVVVNFVREPAGQVHEVWILSDAEAAQKRPVNP